MSNSFTPGPWCVEDPMDFELSIVEANKPTHEWRFIAAIPLPDGNHEGLEFGKKECEANARLIAAAPEMLEALKPKLNPKTRQAVNQWVEAMEAMGSRNDRIVASGLRFLLEQEDKRQAVLARATGAA